MLELFLPLFIYLAIIGLGIYVVITVLNSMKMRNVYLRGILEELRKLNDKNKE